MHAVEKVLMDLGTYGMINSIYGVELNVMLNDLLFDSVLWDKLSLVFRSS